MHIIFGEDSAKTAEEKYTVLELDTFSFDPSKDPVTAYCLVEVIPVTEMNTIENFKKLHREMMVEYGKKNWKFVEDALEHLSGRWHGELDSFYGDLAKRVSVLKEQNTDTWSPIINRSASLPVAS